MSKYINQSVNNLSFFKNPAKKNQNVKKAKKMKDILWIIGSYFSIIDPRQVSLVSILLGIKLPNYLRFTTKTEIESNELFWPYWISQTNIKSDSCVNSVKHNLNYTFVSLKLYVILERGYKQINNGAQNFNFIYVNGRPERIQVYNSWHNPNEAGYHIGTNCIIIDMTQNDIYFNRP